MQNPIGLRSPNICYTLLCHVSISMVGMYLCGTLLVGQLMGPSTLIINPEAHNPLSKYIFL